MPDPALQSVTLQAPSMDLYQNPIFWIIVVAVAVICFVVGRLSNLASSRDYQRARQDSDKHRKNYGEANAKVASLNGQVDKLAKELRELTEARDADNEQSKSSLKTLADAVKTAESRKHEAETQLADAMAQLHASIGDKELQKLKDDLAEAQATLKSTDVVKIQKSLDDAKAKLAVLTKTERNRVAARLKKNAAEAKAKPHK